MVSVWPSGFGWHSISTGVSSLRTLREGMMRLRAGCSVIGLVRAVWSTPAREAECLHDDVDLVFARL